MVKKGAKGDGRRGAEVRENRRRLDLVERTMYEVGWSPRIARALAEQLGCEKRTVYRYRSLVLEDIAEATHIQDPRHERGDFLARLRALQMEAKRDGKWGAAAAMLNCEAKILGLEAPTRSTVKHTGAVSIAGLSDEQAEALAAALDAVDD